MKKLFREEISESDVTAIADDRGKKITYRQLAINARKRFVGTEKRSIVFFLCDHQMETAVVLYELLYMRLIPLLLPRDIHRELLDNLITTYQPQYIYCDKSHEFGNTYVNEVEIEDHLFLRTSFSAYKIHPDVAVLLSTSGTTGSPKLVKLSYDNLYSNTEQVCRLMGIEKGQKGISPLALNYVYGFTFCLMHWHYGATLLITEEPVFSKKFQEFYTKEQANNFAGTPYTYKIMQRIRFWDSEKLDYLHWAMSAGVQMSNEAQIELVRIMKDKFWIMYGQTECTCFISGMNYNENNIKLGSVGKVLENIEAVIDKKTNEIILKSENVCMGYATSMEQLAEGNTSQGILHTGDVGYMDEEGCIYLQGRLSRYIKILGKRVSLDDIENYLRNKYPEVEFGCTGVDDHITVHYTDSKKEIKEEIFNILHRNMNIKRQFVSCFRREMLPRNSSGKIWYAELERMENEGKNTGNLSEHMQ